MKNQNDFIVAGAFLFVAIVVGLIFLVKTRSPEAVPAVPTIVTADAQIQEASVTYSNNLPGGSDDSGFGGGVGGSSIGLAPDDDLEGPGNFGGGVGNFGGGGRGDGLVGGRPTVGVSR